MYKLIEDTDFYCSECNNPDILGVRISATDIAKIVQLYTLFDEQGLPKHMEGENCDVLMEAAHGEVMLINSKGRAVLRDKKLVGWYCNGGECGSVHRVFNTNLPSTAGNAGFWIDAAEAEGIPVPKEWQDYVDLPKKKARVIEALDNLMSVAVLDTVMAQLGLIP